MHAIVVWLSACLLAATALATPVVGDDGQSITVNNPARIVALNYATVEVLVGLGLGDRIVGTDVTGIPLLRDGQVVLTGRPSEVLTESLLSEVFDHPVSVMTHPRFGCPLVISE